MAAQNKNNDELIRMASERLGVNRETVEKAANSGGENLLNKLSGKDREKVSQVLSDPALTKQILSSPKAQELLKNFFGEKKNGN